MKHLSYNIQVIQRVIYKMNAGDFYPQVLTSSKRSYNPPDPSCIHITLWTRLYRNCMVHFWRLEAESETLGEPLGFQWTWEFQSKNNNN